MDDTTPSIRTENEVSIWVATSQLRYIRRYLYSSKSREFFKTAYMPKGFNPGAFSLVLQQLHQNINTGESEWKDVPTIEGVEEPPADH